MMTVCELRENTPVFRTISKDREGNIVLQAAETCIDIPVRLWSLYNHAFFCMADWNPRLVVLNAALDTPDYGLLLDNPVQPGHIPLPEGFFKTTARAVLVTKPDKLGHGSFLSPQTSIWILWLVSSMCSEK